jgi:hypothetical protein
MKPFASADNEMHARLLVADYLAIPEMLAAAGIGGEIVTDKGSFPVRPSESYAWIDKTDPRAFWFRYLPEERVVYFVYNEVRNEANETLASFAESLFRFIDENPVDALVIDIRQNAGGNGALNRSIVHGLIRSARLREPGRLFVLAGRRTFSAALFFALDLEQHTNAIFVGEPIGAVPNHFGDSRRVLLPSSGLTLRISSLYWQKRTTNGRPFRRTSRSRRPPHF